MQPQIGFKRMLIDPNPTYTNTAGLPITLQLKKGVPVMITVNSSTKRYKENGKLIIYA